MIGLVYGILKIPPDGSDEMARNLDLFNQITSRGAMRRFVDKNRLSRVRNDRCAHDSNVERASKNKASGGK